MLRCRRAATALLVLSAAVLVFLEGLAFARAMHSGTGGRWVLPLDDAYIHQQYAR